MFRWEGILTIMRCNMFQFLGRCVIPIPARTEERAWPGATILYAIAVTICLEICAKTVSVINSQV